MTATTMCLDCGVWEMGRSRCYRCELKRERRIWKVMGIIFIIAAWMSGGVYFMSINNWNWGALFAYVAGSFIAALMLGLIGLVDAL